ncbi:MAG: PAS domain-containing protein [Sediminibacterium sp.]
MKYPFVLDSTLSALIQSNQLLIIATNLNGHINFFNEKAAQFSFENNSISVGVDLLSVLSFNEKELHQNKLQACLESITSTDSFTFNLQLNQNTTQEVNGTISVIKNEAYEAIGFLYIGQVTTIQNNQLETQSIAATTNLEISRLRKMEQTIKKQNQLISLLNNEYLKFEKIAAASNQCIVISNTLNKITWVNDALANLLGFSLEDAMEKQDFHLLAGKETKTDDINELKACVCDLVSIKIEMTVYHKSGSPIWVELTKEPIYDNMKKFTGFLLTLTDISLKKFSVQETAKQVASLKKMSFIASHEIRQEFSNIMQVTQTSKLQEPSIEMYQQQLSAIELSTQKMNAAIYDLNDQINFATSTSISLDAFLNQEIEEIVLIDDDRFVNKMNQQVINSQYPNLPIKIFDDVDYALSHINANPITRRKIIVDLRFPYKSGWYFLDEYQQLNQPWQVVVLTASLQKEDLEKSKDYRFVTHFMTKPFNVAQLKSLNIVPAKKLAQV